MSDEEFPRREELMKKYGWEGISTGLRLQPHYVHTVQRTDRIDQHFLKIWLDFIYAGMYTRGILDDKTRILCVVGELVVLDEMAQGENHIRNALMHGATPREILEVMLQATVYVGMPRFVRVIGVLVRILEEDERMAEITDTQLPADERMDFASDESGEKALEAMLIASSSLSKSDKQALPTFAKMVNQWALTQIRSIPVGMRVDAGSTSLATTRRKPSMLR